MQVSMRFSWFLFSHVVSSSLHVVDIDLDGEVVALMLAGCRLAREGAHGPKKHEKVVWEKKTCDERG